MSTTYVAGSPSKPQAGKVDEATVASYVASLFLWHPPCMLLELISSWTPRMQAAQHSNGRPSLVCLPTEILWCIFDACGLGPQEEKTVNEVLSNATCLTRLLLLCRTIHRAICHRPSYWHRIIVSHKNNLKGIQMTLSYLYTTLLVTHQKIFSPCYHTFLHPPGC